MMILESTNDADLLVLRICPMLYGASGLSSQESGVGVHPKDLHSDYYLCIYIFPRVRGLGRLLFSFCGQIVFLFVVSLS